MTRLDDFPEDQIIKVRRATLGAEEQPAMQRLLDSSDTLRIALTTGQDFDRVANVQPGDEALVAGFVTAALRSRRRALPGIGRQARVSPWLLAAAIFGFCGAAFGLRGYWLPAASFRSDAASDAVASGVGVRKPLTVSAARSPASAAPASAAPASSTPATNAPALPSNGVAAKSEPAKLLPPNDETNVVHSTESVGPTPNEPARSLPPGNLLQEPPRALTAVSLFATANNSRNRGYLDLAVVQLRELQRRFQGSPEAVMSFVSLGKLLLQRRDAAGALDQFSTYLDTGGPLLEEAMVGRAQALAALGRIGEEVQTWQTFLTRFPRSVYASQAQQRLIALSAKTSH